MPRKYSAAEIRQIVTVLGADPGLSRERFAGMEDIVKILAHLENLTDSQIEEETGLDFRLIGL